jgi:hypothetical protein
MSLGFQRQIIIYIFSGGFHSGCFYSYRSNGDATRGSLEFDMWVEEVHDLIDRLTFGIADEAFPILKPRSKGQSNV